MCMYNKNNRKKVKIIINKSGRFAIDSASYIKGDVLHSIPDRSWSSCATIVYGQGYKNANDKMRLPKTPIKKLLAQPQNPKHINQWHFIYWRFVCGIQTGYQIKTIIKLAHHHSEYM